MANSSTVTTAPKMMSSLRSAAASFSGIPAFRAGSKGWDAAEAGCRRPQAAHHLRSGGDRAAVGHGAASAIRRRDHRALELFGGVGRGEGRLSPAQRIRLPGGELGEAAA